MKKVKEKFLKLNPFGLLSCILSVIFEGKLSQNTLLTMQEKIDQAKQATVGQDENSASCFTKNAGNLPDFYASYKRYVF